MTIGWNILYLWEIVSSIFSSILNWPVLIGLMWRKHILALGTLALPHATKLEGLIPPRIASASRAASVILVEILPSCVAPSDSGMALCISELGLIQVPFQGTGGTRTEQKLQGFELEFRQVEFGSVFFAVL